ncbi:hypothetical protein B0H12DRAFT_1077061 [Mycena haematopus]|nr:hypothetical protein B0H12DRAFT_1077061 [Mycena haematopus]
MSSACAGPPEFTGPHKLNGNLNGFNRINNLKTEVVGALLDAEGSTGIQQALINHAPELYGNHEVVSVEMVKRINARIMDDFPVLGEYNLLNKATRFDSIIRLKQHPTTRPQRDSASKPMDIDAFINLQQLEEIEEDMIDEEQTRLAGSATAIIALGVIEAHRLRTQRRRPSRLYLCRPQLLRNPRGATAWQVLYRTRNDRAYITTMGFDVHTFHAILDAGFGYAWDTTPIPRQDTSRVGQTRLGARSLDASGALGLLLHYLNSTMREISLQQIFALIPTTVSRYITFGLELLLHALRRMPAARIKWPEQLDEFREYSDLIEERHPRLTGAFASIDGLNLACQTSDNEEIENATYNGWLCTVVAAVLNAPGSWHDSRVARPIYEKLRTPFPRGANQIEGKIRAPIKSGQRIQGTASEIQEQLAFDRELLSYRQTAEWGMRGLQGSFGRLRIPLEIGRQQERGNLLEICVRLNNVRAEMVGINQIRSVYMPLWKHTREEEEIWSGFEKMLFSEQRRSDRVARFHNIAVYE